MERRIVQSLLRRDQHHVIIAEREDEAVEVRVAFLLPRWWCGDGGDGGSEEGHENILAVQAMN